MEQKLFQFKKHRKKLISLYYYEYQQGNLRDRLRSQLESFGIKINPLDYKSFISKAKLQEEKDSIFDRIREFITRARKNKLDCETLENPKVKKRINWMKMMPHCGVCSASNLEWTGIFRRKWFQRTNGQWELKEQQKRICLACKNEVWENER